MRRPKLYPIVALLSGVAASASPATAKAQGLADVRAIKPLMMLLVDTSGSMERLPDTATSSDQMPSCTNTIDDAAQKSRWAVTLEALTGTFSDFRCVKTSRTVYTGAYDENYFLPHFDFTSNELYRNQISDGVLDAFKSRLKFGLMTFDGVPTTIEGETLVAYDTYTSVKTEVLGREGMYSYPDATESAGGHGWMKLFFPGCTEYYGINAGARGKGEEPGSLISVGVSDDSAAVEEVNTRIQESLLAVRPYGGTPIAGMLDDLRHYLKNDSDVKRGQDPYYACRDRFAILLTDGAPDALYRGGKFRCEEAIDPACEGDDCCPYDRDEEIARKIVAVDDTLEKLWVVAFNVNDATAMEKLNRIAQAGSEMDALDAASPNELRAKLTELMNVAQPNATSRSVPVRMNTGRPVVLGGKHFEIMAGFRVGQYADEPWAGQLYRRRIGCDGALVKRETLADSYTDTTGSGSDMFHLELNRRSLENNRNIFTVHPTLAAGVSAMRGSLYSADSNTLDSAAYTGSPRNELRPDGSPFSGAYVSTDVANSAQMLAEDGVVTSSFDGSTPPDYFGDADKNGTTGTAADRDLINKYLRGLTDNRKDRALGDIYHSNPVVLPPLAVGSEYMNVFDPNLRTFYTNLTKSGEGAVYGAAGRPGVVFVGTNDGILHAFNLDTWTSKDGTPYEPGHEFWGFVPPALFDKLAATVAPSHQEMFDGTPVVQDVTYQRGLTSGPLQMGTALIAAVRGAPAYVALDVTQPEEPKLLWQRSFGYLGNTVATPAIAHVKVTWGGQDQIRAVAVLPGGEGTLIPGSTCPVDEYQRGKAPDGRDRVRCWKTQGRSLYVVDVLTGELLQEFDARHFPSPMTGSVAVDGQGFALTRGAYMTDDDGVLWRLSMVSTDPSKWRVAPLLDLFAGTAKDFAGNDVSVATPIETAGRPATYPPLLTRNPSNGNLTILVGTGDVDNLTDSVPHRVVSLEEIYAMDGGELSGTVHANWKLQLEAGESVTGPLTVFGDALYFTTFRPPPSSENLCAMGSSRIVGAHVRTLGKDSPLPEPKLLAEDGLSYVLSYEPTDATNSLLLGMSVAREPICMVGTPESDPNSGTPYRFKQTGASGGGSYTLHSMLATRDSDATGTTQVAGSDLRQLTRTLPISNVVRSVGWASSIE